MSDVTAGGKPAAPATSIRQKIFNTVGWISFLLLVPPVLEMLGMPQLQTLLTDTIGAWGSNLALVLYFYALLFLRVFFGSDQRYTPVLIGYIFSFLLFSISLDIAFMRWLFELAQTQSFLSYEVMNFIAGVVVILLANALSGAKKVKPLGDILLLIILPAAALVCAGLFLPGLLGLS